MPDYLKLQKEDTVAILTFDRDEKRNPINEDSMSELEAKLIAVRDDPGVRVLVLTGSGQSFSAGADLSRLKGITDPVERQRVFTEAAPQRRRLLLRTLDLLTYLHLPTIAA